MADETYFKVVHADGSLREIYELWDSLEWSSDNVGEVIRQMYGMIYILAADLKMESSFKGDVRELVENARQHFQSGLIESPTTRYRGDGI